MKVSVIGLGKLGGPLLACLGASGFEVWGFDHLPAALELLRDAPSQLTEPGVAELLDRGRAQIHFCSSVEDAVGSSEATFIVVPTPSGEDGKFIPDYVNHACEAIGRQLAKKKEWHLVVVTSTVMPGHCEKIFIPTLERASKKKAGQGFGFCYSPEFIALGSFVKDFLYPDLVLIGQHHSRAGDALEEIYRQVCLNKPSIIKTSLVDGEIAKIALNTYVTMKISFANSLASLCESMPGADSHEVTRVLGADSRIGDRYLKGGLAYGGPCFPRDGIAFTRFAEELGRPAPLAEATQAVNALRRRDLAEQTHELLGSSGRLGVLGLSYKPDTPVTEESPGVHLLLDLPDTRRTAYDPQAKPELSGVSLSATAQECIDNSDVIAITTAWPEFKKLDPALFAGKKILDCWSVLRAENLPSNCEYHQIGRKSCLVSPSS